MIPLKTTAITATLQQDCYYNTELQSFVIFDRNVRKFSYLCSRRTKNIKHMKTKIKTLFFLAIELLLCGSMRAQISQHWIGNVPDDYKTIVRSYGNNGAVTFFWDYYNAHLKTVEFTFGTTNHAIMPDGFNIKDMVVDGDILYFCGTTADIHHAEWTGTGIVGYIDLLAFVLGTLDINYIQVSPIITLNKLVEYDDGGQHHIVAIGEEPLLGGNTRFVFFNCDDIMQYPVSYDVYELDIDERPWNVVLTDKLVVCFGYHADPSVNSIYFRKTYKYNIYSPEFDTIHYYTPGNDAYSRTHTIALEKDTIVTAYFYVDNQPCTRIRTIDAATGVITHAQQFFITDKNEPIDMVYSPTERMGVVMEDFYWGGQTNSNFVYFDPRATTGYTATLEYLPDSLFWSMDLLDGKFYLAADGAEWFYKSMATPPTGSPDPKCPEELDIDIDPIETLKPSELERVPVVRSFSEIMINVTDVSNLSNATLNCENN